MGVERNRCRLGGSTPSQAMHYRRSGDELRNPKPFKRVREQRNSGSDINESGRLVDERAEAEVKGWTG